MSLGASIETHLDHEMGWIVKETVSSMFKDHETRRRVDIATEVGTVVGRTLIERAGEKAEGIEVAEFTELGRDCVIGMDAETLNAGVDAISEHVAKACVLFLHGRMMGMKSPYLRKPSLYDDSYNPFANEGGFCNPMKLNQQRAQSSPFRGR